MQSGSPGCLAGSCSNLSLGRCCASGGFWLLRCKSCRNSEDDVSSDRYLKNAPNHKHVIDVHLLGFAASVVFQLRLLGDWSCSSCQKIKRLSRHALCEIRNKLKTDTCSATCEENEFRLPAFPRPIIWNLYFSYVTCTVREQTISLLSSLSSQYVPFSSHPLPLSIPLIKLPLLLELSDVRHPNQGAPIGMIPAP